MTTVLVVDDDEAVGQVLGALLRQAGYEAPKAHSGKKALELLRSRHVDVVITDLRMPEMDGMQLLEEVQTEWPELPVLMLTAFGSVPLAVEAMRKGAQDFVLKPFDREEILYAVKKAAAHASHQEALPPAGEHANVRMVATSAGMKEVLSLLHKAARSRSTVLIRGESGTGKEIIAHEIHASSDRKEGPFVKIHCAALPDTLLESELFGYEKGAFTGATTNKPGRVELAAQGTLFLDEIGDITPAVQVKLLRLLQDREFERLGSHETQKPDVRFVAATHRNLEQMIADGTFREDLFYRLSVVPIYVPPLRGRKEEIRPLVKHFADLIGEANGQQVLLRDDALERLESAPWPGNVRQLENFLERLIVLADGPEITGADVSRELDRQQTFTEVAKLESSPVSPTLDDARKEAEREALEEALEKANNNRTVAARILGVSRRTLYNKLEKFSLV